MKLFGETIRWNAITELLAEKAAEHGDRIALEIAGRRLSYGEWESLSGHVAANLARLGIGRGDRVATLLHNSVEQLLLWFGTVRLGALWAPLNVGLVGDDLRRTLTTTDPSLLVVDTETWPAVGALAGWPASNVPIYVTGGAGDTLRPFEELLVPRDPPVVSLAPSDPALLLFSGGTTGLPKAAVLPHFAHIAGTVRYRQFWQPGPDDVHLTTLQLFHTGCQHGAAIAPLAADICGVIERRFSARDYWRRVCETGATLIDPLGTMLPFLCAQPPGPHDRAHRVRACWFATAHLPLAQRREFEQRFGVRLAPGTYGSTECGGNYVVSARFDDPDQPPGAIGKPWGWVEIMIADDEDRPLPAGTIGNVLLRPSVANTFMLTYFRDPERSAAALRNLWLHTGDLGRLDDRGYFYFEGRQANWLRRRGENISAFEVESVLAQHPDVAECVVVGVPAELGGEEEVKAFIIARGAAPDPAALHGWCAGRLAAFKVPRFIEIVADLPRSAAKREVERAKLKAMSHENAWDAEQHRPAAGKVP